MITIDFSNKKIKVETKKVSSFFKTPLKLSIQSHVTKNEIWSSELNDGWWAEFPNNEMNDVVITDNNGKVIADRKWDIIQDGSELYKSLYFYCLNIFNTGRMPKGIAVGTHDGLFGEWVPCILEGITEAVLVEASQPQFEKLKEGYDKFDNVKLINSLITTDHTDVEGYDADLIKSIPLEKLPKFIIFEHENLEPEKNSEIRKYLENVGYDLNYQNVSCICLKK